MLSVISTTTFINDFAGNCLFALVVAVITYFAARTLLRFIIGRLTALASRQISSPAYINTAASTAGNVPAVMAAVLKRTHHLVLVAVALLAGANFLVLSAGWDERVSQVWFLLGGVQAAIWISQGMREWTALRLSGPNAAAHNPVITSMLSWLLRAMLWSILLLAVLANLGVNITAFVASLGVGGIAIALAIQTILSDVFASAAIGLDKPFEIGDFVVFGNIAGTVEKIGIKTTRIRSISGEEIVCSNTEMLKNSIHNYKRMTQRRILFGFGLTYDAAPAQLKEVPVILKNIIESTENVRFERAHFKQFGDSSLDFEVVYFVTDPGYALYMDIQQAINLQLMVALDKLGVKFAFPSRTIYIENNAPNVLPAGAF